MGVRRVYKVKEEDNLMEKKQIDDILKEYGNLLYRAVYVQVGNRHDTQDILQETFIRYLERLLYLLMKNMKKRGFCR